MHGQQHQNLYMTLMGDEGHYYNGPVWTPGRPNLYDVQLRLVRDGQILDEVGSYAAMRDIRIDGQNILLNGMRIYQKLILAQGYWKDSHLTPPDEEALVRDVDMIREMGYNGLRIHQKNEDERFLYWCDVKGLLVWCEAPSAFVFSDDATDAFLRQWMDIVRQYYNHPCVITWTPINESWGIDKVKTCVPQQHFTEAVYHATKMIDPYRPVIVNDGWVHTISDIITLHEYESNAARFLGRFVDQNKALNNAVYTDKRDPAFADGYTYRGQPVIISEFGGIAMRNDQEGWGYGEMAKECKELMEAFYGDHFKAIFDFANFVQAKQDTLEAYELLKDYIAYIHVKDAMWENGSVVPAGMGDGNVAALSACDYLKGK